MARRPGSKTQQILEAIRLHVDATGRGPTWTWLTDRRQFPPSLVARLINLGALKEVGSRYELGDWHVCPSRPATAEELENLARYGRTVPPAK